MSTTTAPDAPRAPTSSTSSSAAPAAPASAAGQRRRSWRGPALVTAVVLAAALAGLLLTRTGATARLDPQSARPDGARALVHVLRDHGVRVSERTTFDGVRASVEQHPGAVTVVVARPEQLALGRAADLRRLVADQRADLVLADADNGTLTDLDVAAGAEAATGSKVVDARCTAAVPTRAGAALAGPTTYAPAPVGRTAGTTASACYPVGARFGYLELRTADGRRTVLLGGDALTNDRLDDAGDAALAVGALGRHPDVVWWTPDPLDGAPSKEPVDPLTLVPDGVRYGALQLLVVLGVVVLWRGRRLGRLVPEKLPVVVRAVETTRGRGQLYRKARARGRAAQVLRAAAVGRLAVRCGLPRTAPVGAVVAAVAGATGRAAADVAGLLLGHDPTDDASLVSLARDLDTLEKEVHRQ